MQTNLRTTPRRGGPRWLWLALALALAGGATGCASPSYRIGKHPEYFNTLAPDKQARLRAGELDLGYTKQDVYLAVGWPDAKYTRRTAAGESEVWAYWAYEADRPYDSFHDGRYPLGSTWRSYPGGHGWYRRSAYEHLRIIFDNGLISAIESKDEPW